MIKVRFHLLIGLKDGNEYILYKDEEILFVPMPGLIFKKASIDELVYDLKVANEPEYEWDGEEQLLNIHLNDICVDDKISFSDCKESLLEQGWKRE